MSRIDVVIRGAGVVVVAGVLAAGGAYVVNEGGDPTANIWVDASGGTCTDGALRAYPNDGTECSTLDAAHDAADNGDVIRVKDGSTYTSGLTLTGSSSRTSMAYVKPENDTGANIDIGALLSIGDGTIGTAPKYLTFTGLNASAFGSGTCPDCKYMAFVREGSTFIRIENSNLGSVAIFGGQDIDVYNNDLGPCRARTISTSTISQQDTMAECNFNKIDHFGVRPERIVYEGNTIHDYDLTQSCFSIANGGTNTAGQPDCHWRSFWCISCDGLTFRKNVIRDAKESPALANTGQPTLGIRNVTIENNYFGPGVNYGGGAGTWGGRAYSQLYGGFEIGWCNTDLGVLAHDNITYRFNSHYSETGMWIHGTGGGALCEDSELGAIYVYGNTGFRSDCRTPVTYRNNVWSNASTCDASDTASVTFNFYSSNTTNPTATSYDLTGATATPDNYVPTTVLAGCPATDKGGTSRPQATNCDAGADER
jgi:hypothetical protein